MLKFVLKNHTKKRLNLNQENKKTNLNKKFFREFCLDRLKKASRTGKKTKDKKIVKNLEKIFDLYEPKNILAFIPLKNEPNILPFLNKGRKKYNIFVPFMEGVSFKIVKFRLPFRRKKFSIKEPPNSFLKHPKIDLAIVPVVGVDGNYRRIGFGKGMYDRFFAKLPYKPIIVFIQIKECFTKKPICDLHDVKADYYITPEKILEIKR